MMVLKSMSFKTISIGISVIISSLVLIHILYGDNFLHPSIQSSENFEMTCSTSMSSNSVKIIGTLRDKCFDDWINRDKSVIFKEIDRMLSKGLFVIYKDRQGTYNPTLSFAGPQYEGIIVIRIMIM